MSDLIFNLRIGKLHIQITDQYKFRFSLNDYHQWFRCPIVELYEWRIEG